MNILFGHYVADEGPSRSRAKPLPPGSPGAALAAGIGMVHQHFTLADNLTVLDNIVLGTESLFSPSLEPRNGARAASQDGRGLRPRRRSGRAGVGACRSASGSGSKS